MSAPFGADGKGLPNFSYVVDDKLAGMAHPRYAGDLGEALDALKAEGVTALVSLDEVGLDSDLVRRHGLEHRHIPVPDFGAPTAKQADAFVAFVDAEIERGGAVVAHCGAGIGRTGTMLAAYLIAHGSSVGAATEEVSRRRTQSHESAQQLEFLREYAGRRTG
jgi:atypical dual specificity phosphatase